MNVPGRYTASQIGLINPLLNDAQLVQALDTDNDAQLVQALDTDNVVNIVNMSAMRDGEEETKEKGEGRGRRE